MKYIFSVVCFLFTAASVAHAHHGKDFLVVESYDIPHPGDLYFVPSLSFQRHDGGNSFEAEPSLLVGVLPRLAFEVHGHFAKEGSDSFRYEAIAPALHYQLTPPGAAFPVRFGLSAEYEIATPHSEEGNRFEGRLILERPFGASKLTFNLIGERARGGEITVGYAAGYRTDLTERFACGAEAQGQFESHTVHELLLGAYFEPTERITLKAGLGTGFGTDSADFIARAGVVWRF